MWAQLTDTAGYGEWNPFLRRVSGELREGARLVVDITPPGGRAMTFKPTVLSADAERELRWLGRLGVPGIFDGEHSFRLERLADGGTRFVQAERFRGVFVGLFGATLEKTRLGTAVIESENLTQAARRTHRRLRRLLPLGPRHRHRVPGPQRRRQDH